MIKKKLQIKKKKNHKSFKKLTTNNLEAVTNENDKEMPKVRYVSEKKTRSYWLFTIKTIV